MHIDKIRQIANWMTTANLARLELRSPGFELSLTRPIGAAPTVATPPTHSTPECSPQPRVAAIATVCGHFHARHPCRDTPQVTPGQPLKAGYIVGVIDVGDLLLPAVATADGVAGDYLVEDGSLVDYATPLLALA